MENPGELQAIKEVLTAFYHYEESARKEIIAPKQHKYDSLTIEEQVLIPWFLDHLKTLEHCIRQNGEFCRSLATSVAGQWGITESFNEWGMPKYNDYDKVKSVLKQVVREWSTEGREEREGSFTRFFKALEQKYPTFESRQHVKVLVPGAGLGRLNYELVKRGFWCQGNEFSYHMLLASNYILNNSYAASGDSVFPFIHSTTNQISRQLQTRPVFFPDEHSARELSKVQEEHPQVPIAELMSIASGSFTDLYGPPDLSTSRHYSQEQSAKEFREYNKDQFNVIITNFFLDTSSNIAEYIKTLHHALAPGGTWINFGPLLWHFEDAQDVEEIIHPDGTKKLAPVQGLELCLEDVINLAEKWFTFNSRESGIESGYASDHKAMGGWRYKCEFWIATSRAEGCDRSDGQIAE